jgi:3',5'-cyclic AMP phosphodiesterase CpdA
MPAFRFAQISDLHLGQDDTLSWNNSELGGRATERTRAAIEAINVSGPDFVVVTGDLTHRGTQEGFAFAREMLDRLQIPYYVLPGNRDIRVEGERELFGSVFAGHGPTDHIYAAWDVDGARCLTLDPWWRTRRGRLQEAKPKRKKRGGLTVPPEQVSWLQRELRAHPRAPTLIFLHYPLVLPTDPIEVYDLEIANDLHNRAQVLALITRYAQVRAVFCGHLHDNQIVHVPTAGGELLHCMLGATVEDPVMWREVTVDDACITVATHRVPVGDFPEHLLADAWTDTHTDTDLSASIPTMPS